MDLLLLFHGMNVIADGPANRPNIDGAMRSVPHLFFGFRLVAMHDDPFRSD